MIGQALNVPATSVPDIPSAYVIAAILKLEAEALTREERERQDRHQAMRNNHR